MSSKQILGIDIGGSGIKGAPVDLKTGKLLEERYRFPTPEPSSPTPTLPEVTQTENGLPKGFILVVEVIIFAIVGFIVYLRLLRKP